jgi:exosortase/archaeosortase family protein
MNEELTKRSGARSPFAGQVFTGFRSIFVKLFIILTLVLVTLPLFTSFNDFLTKTAEKIGAYSFLSQNIVPMETRAVSLILRPFGINSRPSNSLLYIPDKYQGYYSIYFSWNCLGWQSVVLLMLTLVVGLSGNHKLITKIEVIILGFSGTFLMNLLRISSIVLTTNYFGPFSASIIHNYLGTLFTILWFFFYWWFSYTYILEEK